MSATARLWIPMLGVASTLAVGFACSRDMPHSGPGAWELDGQHAAVPCESCHSDGFTEQQTRCSSCHQRPADHFEDEEQSVGECSACHTEFGWVLGLPDTGLPADPCIGCHGTPGVNAAPPIDVQDPPGTDPSLITVGAHQRHIEAGYGCSECHIDVLAVETPGHLDVGSPTPADIAFGGVSLDPLGPAPVWDRTTATCSDTYCHASATAVDEDWGGTYTVPVWTDAASSPCGSCHGQPPPDPHPASTTCDSCHPAGGSLAPSHANGNLELTF